jgi:hypothetical protein
MHQIYNESLDYELIFILFICELYNIECVYFYFELLSACLSGLILFFLLPTNKCKLIFKFLKENYGK